MGSSKLLQRMPLLACVFLVATCGLVYQLIAGAVASYLIGNSVVQYSLVIGFFLAAMGLGSWLTSYVERHLLLRFIQIQLVVGLIGGFSAAFLFLAYRIGIDMMLSVILVSILVGCLVGMEIPLIIRLLKGSKVAQVTVPQVLSIDYAGALLASLLFPFVLLPQLGLTRAAFLFGLMNVAVGGLATAFYWQELQRPRKLVGGILVATTVLCAGVWQSNQLSRWFEDSLYQDEIVLAEDSEYQRIVITRWEEDYRLYLNGHLQFSMADEYRYHEALVDPVMSIASNHPVVKERPLRVLILGGGDGLALKRVLQYEHVGHVDLVDLDERVVELFRDREDLARLNNYALRDPRVKAHYADAFNYLQRRDLEPYDVMLLDLPDPGSTATNKLFTRSFYGMALRHSTGVGGVVAQATSPFYARKAFWCIHDTMKQAAVEHERVVNQVLPYHTYVPSFGDWGFVLLSPRVRDPKDIRLVLPGRFMNESILASLFSFPEDISYIKTSVNELDRPLLVEYHNDSWSEWNM